MNVRTLVQSPMEFSLCRGLATLTDGFHLHLDQFSSIVKFLMAICFREEGGDTLNVFESEVGGKNRELHRLFDTLQVYIYYLCCQNKNGH